MVANQIGGIVCATWYVHLTLVLLINGLVTTTAQSGTIIPRNATTAKSSAQTTPSSSLHPQIIATNISSTTNSPVGKLPPEVASSATVSTTTSSPATSQTTQAQQTTSTSTALSTNSPSPPLAQPPRLGYFHPELSREKAKEEIAKTISPDSRSPTRLVMNRPKTEPPRARNFAPGSPEMKVSQAATQFGLTFLSSSGDKSAVISPISLQSLLNMILLGTGPNSLSQREMLSVLGYPQVGLIRNCCNSSVEPTGRSSSIDDRLSPHESLKSVLESISRATHLSTSLSGGDQSWASRSGGELGGGAGAHTGEPLTGQVNFTMANLVLTNRDQVALKSSYERQLKAYYDVTTDTFAGRRLEGGAGEAEALIERVNKWVGGVTSGRIQTLLQEGDVDANELAMLVNAAHFKARWKYSFNSLASYEGDFRSASGAVTKVHFMRQEAPFGYATFGGEGSGSALGQLQADEQGEQLSATKVSGEDDGKTILTEDDTPPPQAAPAMDKAGGVGGTGADQRHKDQSQKVATKQTIASGPGQTAATPTTSTSTTTTTATTSEAQPPQTTTTTTTKTTQKSDPTATNYESLAKLDSRALLMPFSLNEGLELAMVILLPNSHDGLARLEENLSGPLLWQVYSHLVDTTVRVDLPKFALESSLEARDTLAQMGLKSIFSDESANLDEMLEVLPPPETPSATPNSTTTPTPSRPAKLGKVLHKAKIGVDESGAEASAASVASVLARNWSEKPRPAFVVDRPFLFVILHRRSNMPLFMGRVASL